MNKRGFTLIELLVYVAIFVVVAGFITQILLIVTRINGKESASSEVTIQLNFVMQRLQQLVRESSNIETTADAAAPAPLPSNGLVAGYSFSEGSGITTADSSGNNNTGTLINGPIWTQGKFGNGLSFDGVNDYVNAGSNAILDNLTVKTISLWLKRKDLVYAGLISKGRLAADQGWLLDINGSSANYAISFNQYWSGSSGSSVNWKGSTALNSTSTWYHVVLIYDDSSTSSVPSIYVNGVANTVTHVNNPAGVKGNDNAAIVAIGVIGALTSNFFNGSIDEIRIYNRALSVADVQALYSYNPSVIPLTPTVTSTVKLRMKDPAKDPTCISLANGVIKLAEGPDESNANNCTSNTSALTSDRVIVNTLNFQKFTQYPGHDTLSVDMQMTYNSPNPEFRIQRTLESAIARVSVAAFDSDVIPGISQQYSVGQIGTAWRQIIATPLLVYPYTFNSNTNVGMGGSGYDTLSLETMSINSNGTVGIGTIYPNSSVKLEVNGKAMIDSGGTASRLMCWKSDGKTFGYCSSVVAADGSCTCI